MRPRTPLRDARAAARGGLTMVELIVASGLAAILMAAVFQLLDVTLDLWSRGETRRNLVEQGAATGELLARDLRALHGGQQGDLLVEWQPFDVDGDSRVDRVWPRLRLVRQASPADIARLAAVARAARGPGDGADGEPADEEDPTAAPGATAALPDSSGLMEVVWLVLPAGRDSEQRGEGVLWRGEQMLDPGGNASYFAPGFFSGTGAPNLTLVNEVTGGVLWFGVQLATQTSIVHDGWKIGSDLADATACWDAWNRGRPDLDLFPLNDTHPGMPAVEGQPLLPRRVRVEMEFERPRDRRRRTRLAHTMERDSSAFEVENGKLLPRSSGSFILVDGEWMEVRSIVGDTVNVRRGARETQPIEHDEGALVHHGAPIVVEIPIPLYSDDWNL